MWYEGVIEEGLRGNCCVFKGQQPPWPEGLGQRVQAGGQSAEEKPQPLDRWLSHEAAELQGSDGRGWSEDGCVHTQLHASLSLFAKWN